MSKPDIRLAFGGPEQAIMSALGKPEVRLALAPGGGGTVRRMQETLGKAPEVRLAMNPHTCREAGLQNLPQDIPRLPALLVSYVYLKPFQRYQDRLGYRDWMMDSGAFSAYKSGTVIDIDEYIACCKKTREADPTLVEVIALDVIGDGPGSLKNALYMKEQGVDAIPVFHVGEDYALLKDYCQAFKKVGLSCRFGEPKNESYRFYDQCFARQWPHHFHSFGWVEREMLMRYPFHSSDSSTWELGPTAYGNWREFGKLSVRCGPAQNLRSEVEYYLDVERDLQWRWRKEMAVLEALP